MPLLSEPRSRPPRWPRVLVIVGQGVLVFTVLVALLLLAGRLAG